MTSSFDLASREAFTEIYQPISHAGEAEAAIVQSNAQILLAGMIAKLASLESPWTRVFANPSVIFSTGGFKTKFFTSAGRSCKATSHPFFTRSNTGCFLPAASSSVQEKGPRKLKKISCLVSH